LQPLRSLSIIGGGSWATALVKIFSESKNIVTWYLRSQHHVDYLLANNRNPNYLGFLELDLHYIRPTSLAEEAIGASDDILFAVPSSYLESTTAMLDENIFQHKRLYVSIKGTAGNQSLVPSVFLSKKFNLAVSEIVVLAGACHAEEIAVGRKTYLTISGHDENIVNSMANAISSPYITVIKNNDPTGVEFAAILKNVIGIVSGMVKGLNYGDNFLAVVISNAMREIKNFLQATDNRERDLYNSAYFGDLLVTAYSEFSRNRTFGNMIGRGYSVTAAESRMSMVAEGFPAVKGMYLAAKKSGIAMPVLSSVYRIFYEHAAPFSEFKLLEKQLQ